MGSGWQCPMARVLLTQVLTRKLQPYQVIRFRPVLRADEAEATTLPVPAYRQSRNYCCGFACALMVLHYFESPVAGRELFARLGTARDGTRQGAIVRELRARGVSVNVRYDVGFERIRVEIDRGKLIIGYLHDAEHWIVIYGYAVDPARIYVADPRPETSCEHSWETFGLRLGRFGMVCSGPRARRRAGPETDPVRAPILLPASSLAANDARPEPPQQADVAEKRRVVQLCFDFGRS